MKTTVKLRIKKLADGNGSYYLDWFQNGKRHYEYLKIYTVLSDRPTKEEREANKESLKLAQQIRNQRENQLIASPNGITPAHKRKQSVLAYCEAQATTKVSMQVVDHLKEYMPNKSLQMQEVKREFVQGFADYLASNLHGNTANAYFSKFRSFIKRAITESIVASDNITFPTDSKLHRKIIDKCRKIAEKENLPVRQSYTRTLKKLSLDQRFRNHPRNKWKARKADRKEKTIAGRLVRELERNYIPRFEISM